MAIGDNTRPVMLTADAARRIAKTVQAYEQGGVRIKAKPLRTADGGDSSIRVAYVADDWPAGTCATVTLYEGPGECVPTESSPAFEIPDVANLSHDVAGDSIVIVGQAVNGLWYLIEAGNPGGGGSDDGCYYPSIAGQDLTVLPGYNGGAMQLLGHDAYGCLQWFSVTECDGGSS